MPLARTPTAGREAPVPARDQQRGRVYAAEAAWEARLDAARRGATRADVAGSSVLLPQERLFGSLAAAQAYADGVVTRRGLPPVRLRRRRGQSKAHWEPGGDDGSAVIALPVADHGMSWALREAVLLHELAHHADALTAPASAARHGPGFTATMLALVTDILGEQAAFVLRVELAEHGARVGP